MNRKISKEVKRAVSDIKLEKKERKNMGAGKITLSE